MRLKITTPARTFEYTPRDGMSAIVIGNRALDDVCIPDDPKVSGPHVRLERMGEAWSFTDQFSDAGTVHNGNKTYNGDLKAGDTLQLGDTKVDILSLSHDPGPPSVPVADAPVHESQQAPQPESVFDTSFEPAAAAEAPPPVPAEAVPARDATLSVFERRVFDRLAAQFEAEHQISIHGDAAAVQRVRQAARDAVSALESDKNTEVNLPFLMADASGPKHLNARIVRKHLHETDVPVFQAGQPQPMPQQQQDKPLPPAAKPDNKPGVAIAVAVIMVAVVVGSIVWALEDSAEMEQDVQQIIAEAEARQKDEERKQQEREQVEQQEQKLIQQVLALMEDKDSAPQDLMDMLDEYEAQARAQGFGTGWDYERTRTYLESRVYRDVELRSADVGKLVYDLNEQEKFRDAAKHAAGFKLWMYSSRHNDRAIRVMQLDESVLRWESSCTDGSTELLALHLPEVAEALTRDDFALASEALKPVLAGAILDDTVLADLQTELRDYQGKAAQQVTGELPPARKAFDKRTDKLPASPDNKLLKAGDYTGRTRLSTLRYDAIEAIRKGEWDGRVIRVWGLEAEVEGDSTTTYIPLVFKRAVGTRSIEFVASEQFANHAPAIQLALFELAGYTAAEDLMALLVYAFDNGLTDDAGRIALKVRAAAPDKLAELDAILSAKWKVPVPEGGFPERDSRVVPE